VRAPRKIAALVTALSGVACAGAHHPIDPPRAQPTFVAAVSVPVPATPAPTPRAELPGGGRELFPTYRLVGFCGTPGAPALGELHSNLPAKTKALLSFADNYAHAEGRKVLPVFELIAVVVMAAPGADGKYRHRVDGSVVEQYLKAARQAHGLLLLNIQPGQSDFLSEVKHFERFLHEPDVGIALDPEWAMKAKQQPGRFYGQTTGADINAVAEYLSAIVKGDDLPEKALVFHQVNRYVLKDEPVLKAVAGVAMIKSVDGLGPKAAKIETYDILTKTMTPTVHAGFKLFFDEDRRNGGKLMTVPEVMALAPQPEYVMYE
jgi:hypothetical protein